MPKDPIVKGIWQHYKGGFYEVLGIASDPTREGDFVVYEAIGSWATAVGLELELLEARNLPSVTNVLVNNPAEDTIPKQDTPPTANLPHDCVRELHLAKVQPFAHLGQEQAPPRQRLPQQATPRMIEQVK